MIELARDSGGEDMKPFDLFDSFQTKFTFLL